MNVGYMAGFFDGEGCISFSRTRSSVFARTLLTNTNAAILEKFRRRFGGDINPLSSRKDGWKIGYCWRLSWSRAVDFVEVIYPHLQIKRRQAETIFAWDAIRIGTGGATKSEMSDYRDTVGFLVKRMAWLNRRGPAFGEDPVDEFLADLEDADAYPLFFA